MKISVKEYAKLIGRSEKSIYKMIKEELLSSTKENGKHHIHVDKNLLKVIKHAQQALEEAKMILLNIEKASEQITSSAEVTKKKRVAKKSVQRRSGSLKKNIKSAPKKPLKKLSKPSKPKRTTPKRG